LTLSQFSAAKLEHPALAACYELDVSNQASDEVNMRHVIIGKYRLVIISKYPVCHYWQVPGLRGTTGVGAPVIELAAET